MDSYETITIENRGAVLWLTLARPDSLNTVTTRMASELSDFFGRLYDDRLCRVVVLRGAGRAFCAGLDINVSQDDLDAAPFGGGFGFQGHLADVYLKMRRCPQPVVALLQGPACGAGFALALACDIRIAADTLRMNAAAIRLGLSSCDLGVTYFLPRMVGLSIASELLLTGRFIKAQRALIAGLVSEVVAEADLEIVGQSYVDDMLNASPTGLRLTKEGISLAMDAAGLGEVIAMENRNQMLCEPFFAEGARAFMEKRAPVYPGG